MGGGGGARGSVAPQRSKKVTINNAFINVISVPPEIRETIINISALPRCSKNSRYSPV